MKLVPFVACLAVALHVVHCGKFYECRQIITEGTIANLLTADSKECYKLCEKDSQCSAISYHIQTHNCILSYCPFVNLAYNCEYESIVRHNPVVSGLILPEATHDFVLTKNCGRWSYGKSTSTIGIYGLKFETNINHPRLGEALTLPGDMGNGNFLYAKTNPQESLRAYSSTDGSFSVAMYVYFDKIPANYAALLELRTLGDLSIHYWVWPDNTKLHYNIMDARWEAIPYQFTPKVWHHFAAAFDAASGIQQILVDGNVVLESVIPYVKRRPIDILTVGGRYHVKEGLFSGSVYCVSVYNKYLSQRQLLEHQRACKDGQVRLLPKAAGCNNDCDL